MRMLQFAAGPSVPGIVTATGALTMVDSWLLLLRDDDDYDDDDTLIYALDSRCYTLPARGERSSE